MTTALFHRSLLRLLGTALLGALAACSEARRPPNLILLVSDTQRFDHIGCYGAARDTSPAIDALASEGVRFETAHSTAPWTRPSVASILTGKFPSGHGLTKPQTGLAEEVRTLAEMLRDEGYRTAGIVSNPNLKSHYGFAQGFDQYLESEARGHRYVSTEGVTKQAIGLLDQLAGSGQPFFLFVLYFDPHYDYRRHPEYGFAPERAGRLAGGEDIETLRRMGPTLTAEEIRLIVDIYDEEVRFTDAGIGKLIGALRERGLYEDSAICFTADHGEEFFERGWLGHVRTLYEELIRVPLIIKPPGPAVPRVARTPVSLVSVVPTFVDLARGTRDLPGSLVPVLEGGEGAAVPTFAEVGFEPYFPGNEIKRAHKRTVLQGGYKLIVDDLSGAVELYRLDSDPAEKVNLAGDEPEITRSLQKLLEVQTRAARSGALRATTVEITDEELEVLRGLGYVGSGKDSGEERGK